MTVSFDKRLAELDAYLQMLIERAELLDTKLRFANSDSERDGLLLTKNKLESLLGSIKHAIVLLQIAKVSIKTSPPSTPPAIDVSSQSQAHSSSTTSTSDCRKSLGPPRDTGNDDDDDDDAFFDADEHQPSKATNLIEKNLSQSNGKQHRDNNSSNGFPEEQGEANFHSEGNIIGTAGGMLGDGSIDWDALYEEEEEDLGSLENQGSVIKHLISQIRIGMDLTKVVLPTFILERRSLLEMYADFFAHPDLFSSIPDYETPEERMVQLVKWYLSAFHAGRKSSVAKKPYNPILGEIFLCHWNLNDSQTFSQSESERDDFTKSQLQERTNSVESTTSASDMEKFSRQLPGNSLLFVAEQVSHHPPVSAFYAQNSHKGISCCAHIYTKSKYLGLSVGVHNVGQGVINLSKHNETYVCTFPSAYGRSILTVPWVELGGSVTISCEQTGYSASIEFVTKPFYGGKRHRVMGEILRPNRESFMTIDGEWNGCIYYSRPPDSGGKQVFVDTTCLPVIKKHVRSISSQESFESRNVWKEVTRALKLRDVNGATAAKSFIEQRQRDLLKDRMEKGVKWKSRYFEAIDGGWTFAKPLADS